MCGREGIGGGLLEKEGKGVWEDEARRQWQEEVESRTDLGQYKNRQRELGRADYLNGFRKGDEIRAEIKRRCEWGGSLGRVV